MQDDTLDIRIHIRAAVRPGAETQRLLADLSDYCWPGGTADRSDRTSRGWLRHFAAITPIADAPGCDCALGRCTTCN